MTNEKKKKKHPLSLCAVGNSLFEAGPQQKTVDSFQISHQREVESDHRHHHAAVYTAQRNRATQNLKRHKMSYESSVFDEPHPGKRFIFFFLVCAEADVSAYVFPRYPDATVKHPCA